MTIDHVRFGAARPRRALVILSGVHGVEAPVNSAAQCDLIERFDAATTPDDVAIVIVHIVNPWGMTHDRRQNESNVDLNRNWGRDRGEPEHHDDYDQLHAIVCPDVPEVPTLSAVLDDLRPLVDKHGAEWVGRAITLGQFRHADGLHFGGDRLEESTAIVERVVAPTLTEAEQVLIIDLHTGHGRYGQLVALSDRANGSVQDRLLRAFCDSVEVTATSDGTSRVKRGPIARGIADDLPGADAVVTTLEVGTLGVLEQLDVTAREQWVHRHGDLSDPDHRAVREEYRRCFTPDDPDWQRAARTSLARHLDGALDLVIDGW